MKILELNKKSREIFETISASSIVEDEEGTNLNAKGINTDYVKHYNSINKTREEEKKEEKLKSRFSNNYASCFCNFENEESMSIESSRILESSLNIDTESWDSISILVKI